MNDDKTALASVIDPWNDSFYQAVRESDAATIELLITADVVVMPPNETTLNGRSSVRAWWDQYFKNFKIEELDLNQHSVIVADKWAFAWGSHSVKIRPLRGGNLIQDEMRFLNVWQHQPDRKWRLARMMWNSKLPIGSALNRFLASIATPRTE